MTFGDLIDAHVKAVEAAGRALEEAAVLMKGQARLFERTVETLRQPVELAKSAVGVERGTAKAKAKAAPKRGTADRPKRGGR
jgi:hypothetical protein